jgi:4,5-DOPA dioxygenase extradiol
MKTMPALFIGHGSPMNAIEPGPATAAWSALAAALPRPRAILCISAHWYTRGTGVTAMERPPTIHDFQGFPQALFDCQYPAPGDPQLARRVQQLLAPTAVVADQQWGLDHGTWSVLLYMYPAADIPVVQLSIDATLGNEQHYALAQQLRPLRDAGVLLLGSGNVVHNLRRMQRRVDAPAADWAAGFETLVRDAILANDHAALIDYENHGEAAQLSIPTPEHYLPLLYVLAQQQGAEAVSVPYTRIENSSLSMLCAQVGTA